VFLDWLTFQSSLLSPLSGAVLMLCAVVISFWLTDRVRFSKFQYGLLASFRSLAFIFIIIVLMNPVISSEIEVVDKPSVAVLLDRSLSTEIETDHYKGFNDYDRSLQQFLSTADTSQYRLLPFSFGQNVSSLSKRSSAEWISLNDSLSRQTDIHSALEELSFNRTIEAAVLYSDGNYTTGADPLLAAENIAFPVFSIALGDSTSPQDLIVKDIVAPNSVFKNAAFTISALISSSQMTVTDQTVYLRKNGEIIEEISLSLVEDEQQRVSFSVSDDEPGLNQYEISVADSQNEFTNQNNAQQTTVEVLDDETTIVHLSFTLHPDVKVVRQILKEFQNTQVSAFTSIGNGNFLEGSLSINPDTVDLFVLHGFPSIRQSNAEIKTISELIEGKPVVIIASENFDRNRFAQLSQSPVQLQRSGPLRPVSLHFMSDQQFHPVMDSLSFHDPGTTRLLSFADSFLPLSNTNNYITAEYFGEVFNDAPVVSSTTVQNSRSVFLNMVGFDDWIRSKNDQTYSFMRQLLANIVSWAIIPPNENLLDLDISDEGYEENEEITISAILKNENLSLESEATITFTLESDTEGSLRTFTFSPTGNGNYELNLGNLSSGTYSYKAVAGKGNQTIDDESGNFVVVTTNAEFAQIERNSQLLKNISFVTGGRFLDYSESDKLESILDEMITSEATVQTIEQELPLREQIWLYVLILLLLTSEWALRKYWVLM